MTNSDELRSLVHDRWQERVVDAFRERGWRPARHDASGGPVPWEEVASTAVETIWRDIEAIVSPIVELLAGLPVVDVPREPQQPAHPSPDALWMSADEVAPLIRTTAHSLSSGALRGKGDHRFRRIASAPGGGSHAPRSNASSARTNRDDHPQGLDRGPVARWCRHARATARPAGVSP